MREFRFAVRNTVPIFFTYLFIGIAFGILMSESGYGVLLSTASAFFIFAGSMQFVAVNLLTGGVSLLTVALTTLLVNARHLFYGISMVDRYRNTGTVSPSRRRSMRRIMSSGA